MAGYLASNIAKNVQIPHGVRIMFQKTGQTNWIDFGDLADVSVTPLAEFFEHFSNHDGKNALAKRILTNRGVTIEATLNEVAPENLRLAFLGDASATAADKKVVVTETLTASNGEYATSASENIVAEADIISVKSLDGLTTYTKYAAGPPVTGEYDISISNGGATFSDNSATTTPEFPVADGDQLVVTYYSTIQMQSFSLLADSDVSGKLQFQIRNMEGGLAQVVELLSVTIAPTGALTVPVDAVQSIPLTVTAQVVNGEFGKVYYANVA